MDTVLEIMRETTNYDKAFKWAGFNQVRVFPAPIANEAYGETKMVYGRKRKVSTLFCEIVIEINGRTKRVADLPHLHYLLPEDGWKFRQDETLYNTIKKLYEHYYARANDSRPN